MRLLGAFLKLIRLPNLFFIVLTQFLFYYCILVPVLRSVGAVAKIDQVTIYFIISGFCINRCCRVYHQ
jgi:4-hydroxybenzoate polyprenyltransferase